MEKIFKSKIEVLKEKIIEEIFRKNPGEKLPTEHEFAKIFGVNRSTINKVLSLLENEGLIERKTGVGSVVGNKESRRLNYRLGVIIERSTGHVYEFLTRLIVKKIQENKYFPLLIDLSEPTEKILSHIKEIIGNSPEFFVIDGIGYFPFNFIKDNLPKIRNLIFINRFETDFDFTATYILSDYEFGGYIGTKYLFEKGKEKIIIVTQSFPFYKTNIDKERLKGVKKAFAQYGINFDEKFLIINKNNEYLRERIEEILKREKRIDGIFAFADNVGRDVQKILEEKNLWLGIDYIMVGYFNTSHSFELTPQFPSISINEEGLVEQLEIVIKNNYPKEIFKIKPILVERKI
ncbi:MAG: GntR family transcriptional regulator [Candidatus Omnitrophica bacterium]|nr:GntR family transcriptional regulator [Candidatus Omnitrophota bacterium]MCM8803368.1 GntR family transcriptional regulator [Candidatus Omnitrophota bacterium]